MQTDVTLLLNCGKILSIVALFLAFAAMISAWRRTSFPSVAYGGVSLSNRRLRWVWILVLFGGLTLGIGEDLLVISTNSYEDPDLLEGDPTLRTVTVTLPLPFYRYERERTYADRELAEEQKTEGILIPWQLLSALFAYMVLVLRWNPQNRWALRILQGRKRKEPGPVA